MNDIRTVELFAGIGGFRLGLERANNSAHKQISEVNASQDSASIEKRSKPQLPSGFRIVWANEWDKYACQIYRKNFGKKELFEGDVRKVNTSDIPDCDLIVGGFPCQPHSLAGKRKGFSDERGEVFHEIIRIAKAKRPSLLLLENVKGLLSSEQGRAFGTVLEELGNIGYWCEWQVINSKHHGVPQNRERVFIIGHLRGGCTKQIFPITEICGSFDENRGERARLLCNALDSNYYKGQDGKRTMISIVADRTRSYSGQGRNLESPKDICNTLSGVQKDNLVLTDRIRRLTERECAKLQGFPEDWTEGVSGTQQYKMLGNAVTVNVIQFLGERILASFDDKFTRSKTE